MSSLQKTRIAYETTQSVLPLNVPYVAMIALDLSARNNFIIGTLTGNLSLSFTNPIAGASGYFQITQDATGGRTLTLTGTNFKTPEGTPIVLSTAANSVDKLYWDSPDGINVHLVFQGNFK